MATKKRKPVILPVEATATIKDAQQKMSLALKAGGAVLCPCCKQSVEIEEHPLSPNMAKVCVILHRLFKDNPTPVNVTIHLADMNKLGACIKGNDWVKLTYWGLLEEQVKLGKGTGAYSMPRKGHDFARSEIQIPKAIKLYNGKFLGYVEGLTDVKEALGKDNEYEKVLAGEFTVSFV